MTSLTLNNDVFILSAHDSLSDLNLENGESAAVNIHDENVKMFVLDTEEGAVHYRLADPDTVDSSGVFILPHLMQGKYFIEVGNPELEEDTYHENTPVDAPVASSGHETYVSDNNFATSSSNLASNPSEDVIPLSNYSSSSEYVLYSNSDIENGSSYAEDSNNTKYRIRTSLHSKNVAAKSIRRALLKIPPSDFKRQLTDTSDIVSPVILLPHTKKLVEISSWSFSKSLLSPQRPVSMKLQNMFENNCVTNDEENEIDCSELQLMPLGYKPTIDLSNIKRIIRKRKNPYLLQEPVTNSTEEAPETEQWSKNSQVCGDESVEYVGAVLNSEHTQDKCFFFEADIRDTEEIIVVQDGHETAESNAYTQQNIDVLLAAAAKNNSKSIFIHQQADQVISTHDNNRKGKQLIIV